jgi:hypothetical protein
LTTSSTLADTKCCWGCDVDDAPATNWPSIDSRRLLNKFDGVEAPEVDDNGPIDLRCCKDVDRLRKAPSALPFPLIADEVEPECCSSWVVVVVVVRRLFFAGGPLIEDDPIVEFTISATLEFNATWREFEPCSDGLDEWGTSATRRMIWSSTFAPGS